LAGETSPASLSFVRISVRERPRSVGGRYRDLVVKDGTKKKRRGGALAGAMKTSVVSNGKERRKSRGQSLAKLGVEEILVPEWCIPEDEKAAMASQMGREKIAIAH